MDESSGNTFANRDSPIPVVRFSTDTSSEYSQDPENTPSTSTKDSPGKEQSRRWRFSQKAKEILSNDKATEQVAGAPGEKTGSKSMQDRLLEKLLAQVIPVDDATQTVEEHHHGTSKPEFSLGTMSTNFRRFNSRIGVVFVFQARVIRLLSWRKYSHTISLLFVYTFVCLDPSLLSVLPPALLLLAIFIPSFLARHPAPPLALTSSFEYHASGPPLAPAPTVKPVKELSKDFFRNMRDLQNCMEDFSVVHDGIIGLVGPKTNFSNEPLSSTLFTLLFLTTAALFIASHLIPYRPLFLLLGWSTILSGHPKIARLLTHTHAAYITPPSQQAAGWFTRWIAADILLDSQPEIREVEIFELQKLSGGTGEWEPWLWSASPWDPLCRERLAGGRPRGTRWFDDVKPPKGWEWEEKKWGLDLWSQEWVEERICTGVEVQIQGERWVCDIEYEGEGTESMYEEKSKREKGKERVGRVVKPSWEEGVEGQGKKGQWRRRRWVRLVRRRVVEKAGDV